MKILLTGASGFVGRSFLRQFADDPTLTIHGLGRQPMPFAHYSQIDLSRPFDLDFQPDVVIHGAARALPWGTRTEFENQNVEATRQVLEFCHRRDVRTLIYLSSSSVFYREEDQLDLTEQSPIGPDYVNLYAETKHAGELLVRQFAHRWVILRPRAVFGPDDTVLFPRILRAAQEGKLARIRRPGPPAIGDLIYIDSLCEYMRRAARDASIQGDFNLTNQEPIEIESFLFGILRELGFAAPTRTLPRGFALQFATAIEWFYRVFRPRVEPPITRFGIGVLAYSKTFDVSKAVAALGPPSIDLATGVKRFVAWQKAQLAARP